MYDTWQFHHIGMACASISKEAPELTKLGFVSESVVYHDEIQKVRLQFYAGNGPRIELIESAAPDSPVSNLVRRGVKFYHMAFTVPDIDRELERAQLDGWKMLSPPSPAVAFGMRPVAFLASGQGNVVELVQAALRNEQAVDPGIESGSRTQ